MLLGAAGTLILVALYIVALVVLGAIWVIWVLVGAVVWLIERNPRRRAIPWRPGPEIPARPPYQYSARTEALHPPEARARAEAEAQARAETRYSTRARAQRAAPVLAPAQLRPHVPTPVPAQATSDIWPKWSASHRRYMDDDLTHWQEEFDALDSSHRPKVKAKAKSKANHSVAKSSHPH